MAFKYKVEIFHNWKFQNALKGMIRYAVRFQKKKNLVLYAEKYLAMTKNNQKKKQFKFLFMTS